MKRLFWTQRGHLGILQARNEEDETIEAKVSQATADPAAEYLPPYQDPPGIDDPFVSE